MPRRSSQSELDLPSGNRSDELIGGVTKRTVLGNGQTHPRSADATAHQPRIAMSARAEKVQQLLGASIDENSQLTAEVRRLEAELRSSLAGVGELRGQLRGAVHDALTDSLTGLANRRSFDLELRAVAARTGGSSPAHLMMAELITSSASTTPTGTTSATRSCVSSARSSSPTSGATAWSPVWAATSSGSCRRGPARTTRPGSRPACASASRPARSLCAAIPRPSSGSRCRSAWPVGMRAKAVPSGMHALMRRCTRRSATAATASASLACSSLSFNFADRCKFRISSPYAISARCDRVDHTNNRGALSKSASLLICANQDITARRHMPASGVTDHRAHEPQERTFTQPFSLSGLDEVQPAGTYTVETDEELLPGLSFPAYRRVATLMVLRARGGAAVEVAKSSAGAAGSSGKGCRPAHPRRIPRRLSRPEQRPDELKIALAAVLAVSIC